MSDQVFEAAAPEESPIPATGATSQATRKQSFNVYTAMLIVSFFCLLLGTLLMLFELNNFGGVGNFPWNTTGATPAGGQ